MRASVLSACLLFACTATRAADWETKDTVLLGGALGVLALDWAQTRKVTREQIGYGSYIVSDDLGPIRREFFEIRSRETYERNPFLGREPSNAEINRYFIVAMAGTAAISYVLPRTYRRFFLGGVLIVESAVIIRNHRIGLGWGF